MTKPSTPVRIDADLYAAATAAASAMSRSTTQQISHWARIGKELEASPRISLQRIAEVLEGEGSYDALDDEEQAVVRVFWEERMEALRRGLRLDEKYAAEGRPYAELDDEGNVVRVDSAG